MSRPKKPKPPPETITFPQEWLEGKILWAVIDSEVAQVKVHRYCRWFLTGEETLSVEVLTDRRRAIETARANVFLTIDDALAEVKKRVTNATEKMDEIMG